MTNEPGIYIEGSHGNPHGKCDGGKKRASETATGQFMYFDTLTWAPIDLDAIDPAYMEPREIAWLNDYHAKVYEKIAPLLDEEERAWLKEATRPLPLS